MLKIISVGNAGELTKEFVFSVVEKDCDLSEYALIDSVYSANSKASTKPHHQFYFPRGHVQKGDYVVLWSKSGWPYVDRSAGNASQHNFFWGLETPIWNADGHIAVICMASVLRHLYP